jgi:hypothetical protein
MRVNQGCSLHWPFPAAFSAQHCIHFASNLLVRRRIRNHNIDKPVELRESILVLLLRIPLIQINRLQHRGKNLQRSRFSRPARFRSILAGPLICVIPKSSSSREAICSRRYMSFTSTSLCGLQKRSAMAIVRATRASLSARPHADFTAQNPANEESRYSGSNTPESDSSNN